MHQKKHYNKGDTIQDDSLRRLEEECEESKDWRITVEDEEHCDGIEVPLSDSKGEPPTNNK
jgi:hypothetical protein